MSSSVFFELLSLDHLIAMTDLEVTRTDKALAALRRFGSDGALASAEQASDRARRHPRRQLARL